MWLIGTKLGIITYNHFTRITEFCKKTFIGSFMAKKMKKKNKIIDKSIEWFKV